FEGELCIMFADTNLGKSILAVQIGDSLTKCASIEPFYNEVEESVPVLYIDFELSAKQFEARYVDRQWGGYLFADNFHRSEFNPGADDPVTHSNYDDHVKEAIGFAIAETKAKVLIIDNITYMRRGTEQAKDALPLMKTLKALKTKYKLSVLVLAHTPKRNSYKPLTVNDLQGSKMLINFADSAFAIGQSHLQPGLRYLKQIKQRNKKEEYGENNICLIRQEKHVNFLRYSFEGYARERLHLRRPETKDKEMLMEQVTRLQQKGHTCRQISDELGIHFTTVGRMIQREKGDDLR
ncbi:MAG: AAA family ATPase, partial [Bacteroidota bacterium]|nr:AAA family ATPase [Bacteroidota bacterium]